MRAKEAERFMNVVLQALREEHSILCKLRKKHEHTYHSFDGGVFDLRENALVYIVYKKLLGSRSFKNFSINWEDNYTKKKGRKSPPRRADICVTKDKSPKAKGPWHYFEFGRYNAKKVQTDYQKLKELKADKTTDIEGKYLVLYDHCLYRKQNNLENKLRRLRHYSNITMLHYVCKRSLVWKEYPTFDKNGNFKEHEKRIFEIALCKIRD